MDFIIKEAKTKEELDGKAFVHYTAWKETYTGLMPQEILDKRSLEGCRQTAHKFPENTLVAIKDGEVVGFACYLPEARDFASIRPASEIMALYVLEKYQKQGIGTALLEKALDSLPAKPVLLFVLENNQKAIDFYRHKGFLFTGKKLQQDVLGGKITEVEMLLEKSGAI